MIITVFAKPSSKEDKIDKVDSLTYRIAVTEAPEDGAANQAIINQLSAYLKIPASAIQLLTGHQSKKKTFGVPDTDLYKTCL